MSLISNWREAWKFYSTHMLIINLALQIAYLLIDSFSAWLGPTWHTSLTIALAVIQQYLRLLKQKNVEGLE